MIKDCIVSSQTPWSGLQKIVAESAITDPDVCLINGLEFSNALIFPRANIYFSFKLGGGAHKGRKTSPDSDSDSGVYSSDDDQEEGDWKEQQDRLRERREAEVRRLRSQSEICLEKLERRTAKDDEYEYFISQLAKSKAEVEIIEGVLQSFEEKRPTIDLDSTECMGPSTDISPIPKWVTKESNETPPEPPTQKKN
jgi:hypothetical protein